MPFPPPGDLPHPGVEHASPAFAGGFFTAEPPGKPMHLLPCIFPSCFYICQHIFPTSAERDVCDQSFLVTIMRNEPEERKDGEEAGLALTLGMQCV